jgi:hypothetical protein
MQQAAGGGAGHPSGSEACPDAFTSRRERRHVASIDVKGDAMKEQPSDPHPLSDLEYDWITLIQNKAQALMAYDQYIKDAEKADSPECAAFFRKVHEADEAQLAEAKRHLTAVLQGKMGAARK